MIIYKEFDQGTEDWFNIRLGKFTASDSTAIKSNGAGLLTLCCEKVAEKLTKKTKPRFDNFYTKHGKDFEDEALLMYQFETGNIVETIAFVEENEDSGCSPDGLVNNDGGVEVKCLSDVEFVKILYSQKVKGEHYDQIQNCLRITGRQWWDYVVYNPNFEKSLWIKRVYPDFVCQNKIEVGLNEGIKIVKAMLLQIKSTT